MIDIEPLTLVVLLLVLLANRLVDLIERPFRLILA